MDLDRQLFLFLNSCHIDFLDPFFFYISTDWAWIPLYILLISLIINKFKRRAWLPILAIVLSVAASDQISSLIKRTVKRSRPTHDRELEAKVHTVNGYTGGLYGFVSSHAANTFGVAFLVCSLLSLSFWYCLLLFFWATIVSYSRIYLGVHFPLDIFFGGLLGLFIGYLFFLLEKRLEKALISKVSLP